MARVFNFSAGPSMLPESVLSRAAAEMMDYHGSGQSAGDDHCGARAVLQHAGAPQVSEKTGN